MTKLTKENYIEQHTLAVRNAALIYQIIKDQPFAELLEKIGAAEAVGPILDPTLYRDKSKALGEDKKMIEALYSFQMTLEKLLS
jgi:hypothetical protein